MQHPNAPVERIDAPGLRIQAERTQDRIIVRFRPSDVPVGCARGPRTAIELTLSMAAQLAAALQRLSQSQPVQPLGATLRAESGEAAA